MLSGMWLSLVERFVRDEEVACSNHVIPMLEKERNPQRFQGVSLFLYYVIFNSRIIGTERKGCTGKRHCEADDAVCVRNSQRRNVKSNNTGCRGSDDMGICCRTKVPKGM